MICGCTPLYPACTFDSIKPLQVALTLLLPVITLEPLEVTRGLRLKVRVWYVGVQTDHSGSFFVSLKVLVDCGKRTQNGIEDRIRIELASKLDNSEVADLFKGPTIGASAISMPCQAVPLEGAASSARPAVSARASATIGAAPAVGEGLAASVAPVQGGGGFDLLTSRIFASVEGTVMTARSSPHSLDSSACVRS